MSLFCDLLRRSAAIGELQHPCGGTSAVAAIAPALVSRYPPRSSPAQITLPGGSRTALSDLDVV